MIDKLQCQIWVSPTSGVLKPYNLFINTLILLQGFNKHPTRFQQGRKHCQIHGIFSLVAILGQTKLLQQEFSIWEQ